ncbi:sugar nucleotide-binding protein [Streptomyces camelliae]|uniref:Sugar nucleotide-binding protein n=1 Tax=Streptomyces camelliae TaxID=3004093 RepID=A0ABY7PET0_9ACTN|nr:sugar nucleotide-binding protein [Streptomyces sp. HUAS 2-6]WBO69121.1 sugar nucleotide-binding protein [Streptomyces sp. HUAS 2-6]
MRHATGSGDAGRYEPAVGVFRPAGADPDRVRSADSRSFARPAPRPACGVLGHERWAAVGLPPPAGPALGPAGGTGPPP